MYKGFSVRLTIKFSKELMEAGRQLNNSFLNAERENLSN